MSNYTKTTNFAAKDSLPSGNANKIVKGTEIDTEFDNIATASATKADIAGPTFTGTVTIPTVDLNGGAIDGTTVGASTAAAITGTTIVANTSINIAGDGATVTGIKDEDDMSSNSATKLATQQSIKAYVDSQVTAQDLDFQADSGGALSIDLDSETLTFTGGTGVDTSGSGNAVTFAIDSTVATLTDTQTLTNKTLTSPTLNTPTIGTSFTIGSATITEAELEILDGATVTTAELNVLDGITSTTAELNILDGVTSTAAELNILDGVTSTAAELNILDGVTSTAAELNILDGVTATTAELNYVDGVTSNVQTQLDAKAPIASPTFTGTVTVPGLTTSADILFGDNDKAIFGAGSDLQIYHDGSASYIQDTGTGALYLQGDGGVNIRNAAGTENKAVFASDGAVTLYHNNAVKFATTSTGIDVTGTVTADGLTVDGASAGTVTAATFTNTTSASGTRVQAVLQSVSSACNVNLVSERVGANFGADFIVETSDTVDGTDRQRLRIAETGDISFYEDTGTTPKLFWDSSAESLGIGTTSPARELEVAGSGNVYVRITAPTATDSAGLELANTGATWLIQNDDTSNDALTFDRAGTEAMRIDSSGNAHIGGTTSITTAVTGDNVAPKLIVEGTTATSIAVLRQDTSIVSGNSLGSLGFYGTDTTSNTPTPLAAVQALASGTHAAGDNPTDLRFLTTPDNSATMAEAMRIDSSGLVGIGTSSPSQALHVSNAASMILNESTTSWSFLRLKSPSANGGYIQFADAEDDDVGQIFYYHGSGGDYMSFTTNASEAMRLDSSGNVGIGTSSPDGTLHVKDAVAQVYIQSNDGQPAQVVFGDVSDASRGRINYDSSDNMIFEVNNLSEKMRIDASGNVLVGKSASSFTTAGVELAQGGTAGKVQIMRASGGLAVVNTTNDGAAISIYKGTTHVGSIGTVGGSLAVGGGDVFLEFNASSNVIQPMSTITGGASNGVVDIGASLRKFKDLYLSGDVNLGGDVLPTTDAGFTGHSDLGDPSLRYEDAYVRDGVTTGSDGRDKQDIEELSDAEQRVAVACKGLLRKWRWKSSVAEKGDDARIHFGIIAQDLQAAFEEEGLDAGRYAMFINSTWTDEETGEERSRMGVRYSELLAFIIAAI
jgi:hypothetical protein